MLQVILTDQQISNKSCAVFECLGNNMSRVRQWFPSLTFIPTLSEVSLVHIGNKDLSAVTFLPEFPPNNTGHQPRSRFYSDSLSALVLCLWTPVSLLPLCYSRLMSVLAPPGTTHRSSMPATETPLAQSSERWSQTAWSGSQESLTGVCRDLSHLKKWGHSVGAGFDPPRTHLPNRTRSVSHAISFIVNNVDSQRSNWSQEIDSAV